MSKSSSTARAKRTIKRTTAKNAKGAAKTVSAPRAKSKQSQLIAMLKQPDGATIVEITKGATTAHVRLDVGGTIVTSAITNAAVDELKLAVGQKAYAVVKASDVMIAID